MRLVDDDDLVGEVDAERFARGLLQEEVVGQEDELRYASLTVNNNRASSESLGGARGRGRVDTVPALGEWRVGSRSRGRCRLLGRC